MQPHSPQQIKDAIINLYNNRELHRVISYNNIDESFKYSPTAVMAEFYSVIEK